MPLSWGRIGRVGQPLGGPPCGSALSSALGWTAVWVSPFGWSPGQGIKPWPTFRC